MKLPQYTIRNLLTATTFSAFGVSGLVWVSHATLDPKEGQGIMMGLASVASIGAGIGAPLRAKTLGAALAVLIAIFGLMVFFILVPAHRQTDGWKNVILTQ